MQAGEQPARDQVFLDRLAITARFWIKIHREEVLNAAITILDLQLALYILQPINHSPRNGSLFGRRLTRLCLCSDVLGVGGAQLRNCSEGPHLSRYKTFPHRTVVVHVLSSSLWTSTLGLRFRLRLREEDC